MSRTFPALLTLMCLMVACNTAVPQPPATPTARNDNASLTAETGGSVMLDVLANDTASTGQTLEAATIDLDAQTAGIQTSWEHTAGAFEVKAGKVQFTAKTADPATAVATYTVRDSGGGTSKTATITVKLTEKEAPAGDTLFSFESGPEGWKALNDGGGSVEVSGDFHTQGTKSLLIHSTTANGDWFSVNRDMSFAGKTTLSFDLKTGTSGTSYNIALQTGTAWTWCEGANWPWVDAGKTVTATLELSTISCNGSAPDLSEVHALHLYFNKGDFYIDNVSVK
ncbi:Ig-like domain-containing protein [Deinococcus cellulosilyticus]|uniref:Mannanase galactose-binding domain-containing protein n=1 Tax=Deinococcus cellulosilyticus (strain DSM 18568 / NBRC 106333 / KACC 11606 / 5516J-15) TaxID=1223518 RepID=A0A511MYA0_DEIC1|nr:Ig-like domain-containing protein [Deinococcus cellulosilyticus]GEM45562.1 hypothetical protein DC3_11970 [Deinococcus cellulosilyticus NBRC 106333 = KACC 11606]